MAAFERSCPLPDVHVSSLGMRDLTARTARRYRVGLRPSDADPGTVTTASDGRTNSGNRIERPRRPDRPAPTPCSTMAAAGEALRGDHWENGPIGWYETGCFTSRR